MNIKRVCCLLSCLALLVAMSACGGKGASSSDDSSAPGDVSVPVVEPVPEPEPEPEPVLPYVNPLTGEGCETDIGKNRPIAIMLNNLKKALPQLGISQADIIYEAPAEGGITRMLGVFQSVEGVGDIGTVRSARDYYVSIAAGMDAVYLHAGGSPQAYSAIQSWGVTALDCVNGPYEGTLYWRDATRRKNAGWEHSVLTSGEKILELLPTYKRVRLEHQEGYQYPMSFAEDATPAGGEPAQTVTVKFSNYKTGVFRYDADTGLYLVEEYGKPYVDGNNDEQVAVKNVLVLRTDIKLIAGDSAGRLSVRMTGSGEGYFICGGKAEPITWSKESNTSPIRYQTANGTELPFGIGPSYINIVDKSYPVTIE